MIRTALLSLIFLMWLFAGVTRAADLPEPIVEVDFEKTQTIPGQFLPLRITVLVPTWMPQPVVFPPLDGPNLRVRLPDRATSPTSKRIEGEEWSGVSRRYMISPMIPGTFTIPGGAVEITYADPENTSEPLSARITLAPTEIEGIVPEGAEGLDPFIAAKGLKLSQELPETTQDLKPGDSLRRSVTATISGASPMVLPQLMTAPQIDGFAAYADHPVLEETEDRGVLSGSRQEVLTLMVQGNGSGELPPIELSWYNIDTGKIETATLEPVAFSASGAPAAQPDLASRISVRSVAVLLAITVALALLLIFVWPRLSEYLHRRKERRLAGKDHAQKILLTAIGNRDYPATVAALQTWAERPPRLASTDRQTVLDAVRPLSAQRYGKGQDAASTAAWKKLAEVIAHSERDRRTASRGTRLPVLNP